MEGKKTNTYVTKYSISVAIREMQKYPTEISFYSAESSHY